MAVVVALLRPLLVALALLATAHGVALSHKPKRESVEHIFTAARLATFHDSKTGAAIERFDIPSLDERDHYTTAQEYNRYRYPCWDNISMVKLQLAIDGTDGGPERTKDVYNGLYKNLTGCWDPKIMNDSPEDQLNSMMFKHETENTCAISFSGIIHGKSTINTTAKRFLPIFGIKLTDFCGYKVYDPYITNILHHTNTSRFREMMAYAASPACSGGVKVTGVSLGGMYASLLAACAMDGKLAELGDGMPASFPVDGLWTYGAAGVTSLLPIQNKSHPDGCLKGQRLVMGDVRANALRGELDYLPYFGNLAKISLFTKMSPFLHPKISLTELVDTKDGVESRTWPCDHHESVYRPEDTGSLSLFSASVVARSARGKAGLITHECRHYIDIMEEMGGIKLHREASKNTLMS